jgi:hypothetical protein
VGQDLDGRNFQSKLAISNSFDRNLSVIGVGQKIIESSMSRSGDVAKRENVPFVSTGVTLLPVTLIYRRPAE